MAVLHKASENKRTLEGIISYIADQKAHDDKIAYYSGFGVQPFYAVRDMLIVKELYSKTDGSQYKHIILLMEGKTDENIFIMAAKEIADTLYNYTRCQIVFAIHSNTDKIHLHVVINSVRYTDGTKLNINNKTFFTIIKICNHILQKFGLEEITTANKFIRDDYGENIIDICQLLDR